MKISREVERVVVEQEVDDIICNKCGKSCRQHADSNFEGLLEVGLTGGYGSELGDMTTYTFSLCERCIARMFREFVVSPGVHVGVGLRPSYMLDSVVYHLEEGDMTVDQLRQEMASAYGFDEESFVAAMATLEECGFIERVEPIDFAKEDS